jgi:tetratricopeptide (TPR) repeat protein
MKAILSCLLVLSCILSTLLFGQSVQAPKSRPESFEWDHQIDLYDEATQNGNYSEAEGFAHKSLEIVEQLQLGDAKRATSLFVVADSLRHQKKFAEAEPLFRESLALREKILPPIHHRTAYTLEGLAAALVGQKRPTEAEPYYLRAIAIWDRVGEDEYESCPHGKVLDGLGRVYFQSGNYQKAEPLYERALDVWTKGKEHCTVIRVVIDDLAALYWAQGKIERCEQMYRQTIPLLQKGLSDEHPEFVAQEQTKLARVYMAENKPADAVTLYEQAVPVLQQSGPRQRELLLQSLKNEAALLDQLHRESDHVRVQGQIDAIEGIKAQSVEPAVQWQGLMDLALHSAVSEQRLGLLRQALAPAEMLGPGHELAQTLQLLGNAETTNEPDKAEAHLKRALSVNQQVFGNNSTEVAEIFGNLAFLYEVQKKETDEEACMKQQVAILEKATGRQIQLSTAQQNLGFLYAAQKRYPEAESAYQGSLRAAESAQPRNDLFILGPVQRLAQLYKNWERYDQAVTYYTRAVELEEASPRPNRLVVGDLETLADLLRKLNRNEEAQKYDEERKQAIDRLAKLMAGTSAPGTPSTGSPTK